VLAVIVVLLGVGGYAAYTAVQHFVTRALIVPGCQAGNPANPIALDFAQTADAASIAGVALRKHLPHEALTIAYATALQEAKLENPDYGDLDSVGMFQQRPSEGWGRAAQLEDPAYAAGAFFAALVKVPRYTKLPVYEAAQDVQRSADGYAYEQWVATATLLANYFTGYWAHGVSCWYTPPRTADLATAVRELTATFGPQGEKGVVMGVTTARSAQNKKKVTVVQVKQSSAWTVAGWLVANAQEYGIGEVRYAGYEWTAADGSMGWQPDAGPRSARDSIVAG
jgi:hypothetical protein